MKFFTTGEVSKRLGVSVRTLRYYDQIGLVQPHHKENNGRRYYSEEDIITIEKITILKQLSMSLDDIEKIVEEVTIHKILTVHKNALERQKQDVEEAIRNTNTVINIMKVEGKLSWEHLLPLVRQSENQSNKNKAIVKNELFKKEEQQLLQDILPKMEQDDNVLAKWINIKKRIDICVKRKVTPDSEEGQIIASDIMLLSDEMFKGNEALAQRFYDIRKSEELSNMFNLYPIDEEVIHFMEEAISVYEGGLGVH